ncbi:hypothetical protein MKW92_039047 [Papaver armeniacum]|nr:hypothetical protein MKW92_039047 [Papaver armeniacum]
MVYQFSLNGNAYFLFQVMGAGAKKKNKCSRKVKYDVHVDETLLDATLLRTGRVVSAGWMFVHPARYRAYTCKVTTYSSPKVLRRVRKLLSLVEQEKFMSTAIGPLLHLPMQTWSAALFHFLLASQISMDDEGDKGNREEMRVMVCGKELSFGKKEFALISGLSFMKSNHNFSRPSTKPRLKMKHFPDEGKPVTGKHLKILLFGKKEKDEKKSRKSGKKEEEEKKSRECHQSSNSNAECEIVKVPLEYEDKVKLSLLYVVHGYCDHWYLVDNLVDFNSYPWAEIAFSRTIVKSNSALAYQIKADKLLVVWGLEVLPKLRSRFESKTIFANWRPYMHSVTCDLVITHESLLNVLEDDFIKLHGEVCDDIMWHKEDAKHLVMLGLCEGPLVDDAQEDSLKNENVVEKEDLFEKGEEENMLESENVFVDEQDKENLLGNENMEEEDLFEKDDEEARVAHPISQPDVLCSRTSTSVIASFGSFVKNAMIGHTEDLKKTVIGEMEVFKSAVKGQLEELSIQVSNSHKTMLNYVECVTAEIKSIKDKIGGTQTYNAFSKTKTVNFDGAAMQNPDVTPGNGSNSIKLNPPYPYNPPNKEVDVIRPVAENICNEEGGFDGAAMQKPNVTPGNGSNSIELSPRYPYNPPNKEVDVSRAVAENICNSSTGKKRKRQKNKLCTGPVAPIIVLSDDVTKGQGRGMRKINPAPSLLPPYTPTGKVARRWFSTK